MSAPDALLRLVRRAQADLRLPSVSAAVVVHGDVVWAEALGLADAGSGREAGPDTQYRVGSITKTFTVAAVLELAREGRLALDDPLSAHLPETYGRPLTLHRLLCHLSGIQREIPGEV